MKQILFLICLLCPIFPFSGHARDAGLDITGKAALTIDPETHEIIYAKNIDKRAFPASTTKLVTALLLAELRTKNDLLTYSAGAKAVYPFKLDLPAGTIIRADYAMDALLLFSANDIAYMIGENIGGSIEEFSLLMNEYMMDAGLHHTHFVNPSGLHDPGHYTTAYDLSIIARKLYEFPWIMETIKKKESRIIVNDTMIELHNRNKLVLEKGCIGGKTGWTPDAGRCLVALFERDRRKMVGVVLNSVYDNSDTTVFADMEKIVDYSYSAEKVTIIVAPSIVKTIPLSFRLFPFFGPVITRELSLELRDEVKVYPRGDAMDISFTFSLPGVFNINPHTPVGILTVTQREQNTRYHLYPTISSNDILRLDILPFYTAILACLFMLFFISLVVSLLRRKK